MAQWIAHLATVGVIACLGCDRPPAGPDPGGSANTPSANTPNVFTTPPIRGLVREPDGGPIAGATVGLYATGLGMRNPRVVSDEAGIFVVPPSADVCQTARTFGFEIFKAGYWFPGRPGMACTQALNPPEVAIEVKGQRAVTLASDAPVEITLSNDDVNWITDENGYSCGPCKIVAVTLPARSPVIIQAERSGPIPIYLWVEGDRGYGDLVGLREVAFSPTDTAVRVNMLADWRDLYLVLKVGLPYGGRFAAGSPPLPVRIEMR